MNLILTAYKNYPTEWPKYADNHLSYLIPPQFEDPTATYRWGARYRAAKAYRGAEFDDYSDRETAEGYSCLLGFSLAFSAFEYFHVQVLGLNVPEMTMLLEDTNVPHMSSMTVAFEKLIMTPETDLLFKTIHPHLDGRHQKSIDKMLAGTETNLIRIFAAIRHAFVHGHLTPNMGKCPPSTVSDLCRFGFQFLMEAMDGEFSRRINWSLGDPIY